MSASSSPPLLLCLTNDVHSHMATASKLFDALVARQREGSLIIDTGDFLEGTALYHYGGGALELELLDRLYDYACPGNHGFGPLTTHSFKRCQLLMLNILSAASGQPRFIPWVNIEHGGRRIALTAVMSPEVFSTIPVQERRGLTCTPHREALVELIAQLTSQAAQAQRVDELIILSHCGIADDLAQLQGLPHVRLILSAHCHSPRYALRSPCHALTLTKAREHGQGYVRISHDAHHTRMEQHIFAPSRARLATAELEDLNSHLEHYWQHIDRVVGHFNQPPSSRDELTRVLVDALQRARPETLCVINKTCLRQSLEPGVVTYGQLLEVFPFGNSLFIGTLTYAQLHAALDVLSDELRDHLCFGRALDGPSARVVKLCTTSYLWRNIFASPEVLADQDLGLLRDHFVELCLTAV